MAKRTLGQLVTEARKVLSDTVVPYRYTESAMYDYINNLQYEIKRIRPDCYIGNYNSDLPIYTETDSAVEIPFPSILFQAAVWYIAGSAELRDDEHTVEGRATSMISVFNNTLTTTPGRS